MIKNQIKNINLFKINFKWLKMIILLIKYKISNFNINGYMDLIVIIIKYHF